MRAINSQNIDDTFATTSFIIGNPTAFIDPIGDHVVGDKFTITGSTNIAAGNNLLVEIVSSSFKPSQKSQSGEFSRFIRNGHGTTRQRGNEPLVF